MTPSGIEPATFWLVAQCLTQLRYLMPQNSKLNVPKYFQPKASPRTNLLKNHSVRWWSTLRKRRCTYDNILQTSTFLHQLSSNIGKRKHFNSNKSPTWCNIFPVYYPDVYLQLNMFRAFSAHHQELNDCSGSLWFYLRIVVTVVLFSKVIPEVAIAVIELLMTGGKRPKHVEL